MAATETTQESTLILPEDQSGNVSTSESNGRTTWTFDGNTTGVVGSLNQGKSVFRGDAVRRSTFSFTEPNVEVSFRNNVNKAEFNGTDKGESLRFSGATRNSNLSLGGGKDSVLFGANSKSINNTIDLGQDGGQDIVEFASLENVKDTVIKNFGKQDILKIGGQEYTYKDLQDADFGSKLTIKFQD